MSQSIRSAVRSTAAAACALPLALFLVLLIGSGATADARLQQDSQESDTHEQESDTHETGTQESDGQETDSETADPAAEARDELLREGAVVYSQICSSCHQPGGAGLSGQFPPLIDNPHVDDTDYVVDVIVNGRSGPIEVGGETYDSVMPSFSTLSDDEVEAVITYIQNDFEAPAAAQEEFAASGPVAGTELPALTNFSALVAYLLAASVVGLVLFPRLISVNDRLSVPWLDAWLKTAVIVFASVFLTVVVPDWALKTSAVSKLSRFGQDFIGTSLFGLGLIVLIGGLWFAHRESRI